MSAPIFLKIVQGESKYGIYLLKKGELSTCEDKFRNEASGKPTRRKVRLYLDGISLHYILKEFVYSPSYRKQFVNRFYEETTNTNVIIINLVATTQDTIDYNWNHRVTYLVRERCELEHALSWLSTLGGAFSALGDYFSNFAKIAGKISYHQLLLALRMDDPYIVSRCKLYFSLSLIQQHEFKKARRIIEHEYAVAKGAVVIDTRLVKMCLGIWSKLQYEHKVFRQLRTGTHLKLA